MYKRSRNRRKIGRWVFATCVSAFCFVARAQNSTFQNGTFQSGEQNHGEYSVSVNLYNRYDDHRIDPSYMGNKNVFTMLDSLMRDSVIINHTKKINVVSSSSIEGSESYNRNLSEQRMLTVSNIFRARYSHISSDMWNFSYIAENWSYLERAVVNDLNVPNRDGVLHIINMKERHPDDRESMLKNLDGGTSWSYIHTNILPPSRGLCKYAVCAVKKHTIRYSRNIAFQNGRIANKTVRSSNNTFN